MPAILGLNAVFHDSSAAVLVDGRLVVLAEEDRYTRIKGGKRASIENTALLPYRAIDEALRAAGLSFSDLDCVAYSFDPAIRRSAIGRAAPDVVIPDGYGSVVGENRFCDLILQTEDLLSSHYGRRVPVVFIPHHDAHLASTYYSCPWDEAALLAVDGIAEHDTCVWAAGRSGRIKRRGRLEYPHSLGFLWESVTQWLGMTPNQDEGSVMALAAYGRPGEHGAALRKVLRPLPGGIFCVDPALARFRSGDVAGLESLLGPRRAPSEPLLHEGKDRRHADVAAALQALTEEVMLGLAAVVRKETGLTRLALAGGVALNCQANGVIARSGLFDGLWVFPAAKDCGTAYGAACAAWLLRHGPPARQEWAHAFHGAPDLAGAAGQSLAARGLSAPLLPQAELIARAAALLCAGKVLAWYEGAMEVGPRALGHRSLLADPRLGSMRQRLNLKVKHRQSFRPYGAVVRQEDAGRYFDIPSAAQGPCRFMLCAVPVMPEARARVPALLHEDGTCRPQVLGPEAHPRLRALLAAFGERTGEPILINTSFNDREPMVGTPEDALNTFLKTDIDALVLEDRLVVK